MYIMCLANNLAFEKTIYFPSSLIKQIEELSQKLTLDNYLDKSMLEQTGNKGTERNQACHQTVLPSSWHLNRFTIIREFQKYYEMINASSLHQYLTFVKRIHQAETN